MEIRIRNFKILKDVSWVQLNPGWHVIVGDSGWGKSTMLEATQAVLNALEPPRRGFFSTTPTTDLIPLEDLLSGASHGALRLSTKALDLHLRLQRKGSTFTHTGARPPIWMRLSAPLDLGCREDRNRFLDRARVLLTYTGVDGLMDFIKKVEIPRLPILAGNYVFREDERWLLALSGGCRRLVQMVLDLACLTSSGEPFRFASSEARAQCEAIVLIDDVEAALSPSQQSYLGEWLCGLFPKVTFLVTSRTPFICHSATSIFQI